MKIPDRFPAVLLAFTCTTACAASFDCHKAQRPVEKVICSDSKLNVADEQMGRVYRNALGRLSSSSTVLLRADQVQWLAWAQQVCRSDDAQAAAAVTVQCLLRTYLERTKQLRAAVVRYDALNFLMRTQYLALPSEAPADMDGVGYPGFGTLKASWPAADTPDPAWTAWNRAIEGSAFLLAGGGGEHAERKPLPQRPAWTPSLAASQDSVVIGQIKSVEQGRVTATLNLESMGHGAAHPNEAFETLTWLLGAGRFLRSDDVFAAGSAWKPLVANACWNAITTGDQKAYVYAEVNGPNAQPLQEVIADERNWTLEHDGLHISYPEYTVAPRAAAMDDTIIPWSQLKPVLAPEFTAP